MIDNFVNIIIMLMFFADIGFGIFILTISTLIVIFQLYEDTIQKIKNGR